MLTTNLLITLLFAHLGPALSRYLQGSNSDKKPLFPIYAGGTGDETINCFLIDEDNDRVIVGGNTNSDDFAWTEQNHGFLFALDLVGNWMWSKYIYNGKDRVSDITGCQLNSDGSYMTVMG